MTAPKLTGRVLCCADASSFPASLTEGRDYPEAVGPVPSPDYVRVVDDTGDGSVHRPPESEAMTLTPEQSLAVANAVEFPFSVLTGGPGTGKTYTETAILAALGRAECLILAPTGKAANRAREVTGHPASTIHRFVGRLEREQETWKAAHPGADLHSPEIVASHDYEDIAGRRCLIVDEASMVSIDLFARLLRAWTRPDGKLVVIGDADQLPSIGAGNVLSDLIASGRVPTVRLTTIQRQASDSAIIRNAHAINAGRAASALWETNSRDWFFHRIRTDAEGGALESGAEDVPRLVLRARDAWGLDPIRDVQVLAGMRRGPYGVHNLNRLLREALNPRVGGEPEVRFGDGGFRAGDKVLCGKNDYRLGVVNGDVGVVERVVPAGEGVDPLVEVRLQDGDDDRLVAFEGKAIGMLNQAWAMTVHKSQGSEYPFVVDCMDKQCAAVFGARHFYTAVTRAKTRLCLVSLPEAVAIALDGARARKADRFSRLRRMLAEGVAA